MPFLGSQPADQYQSLAKQTITGDGSTSYTLNRSVTNAYDMEVFINNVRQEPDTSYTASGNTITFTAAVTASDSCYLIYQGQSVGSINPPANSVGGSQIQNTSVTHNHLHTNMDLSSKTVRVDAMNMGTGTDQWQLATQSAVSNRFAVRSTHTTLGDGNPFIIYQPSASGAQNDALVITADGYVTQNKLPSFFATITYQSNVSLSGGANHRMNYNTTTYNNGNHYSTSTNAFTAPVSGMYIFTAGAQVNSINNTSWASNLQLRINGSHKAGVYQGTNGLGYEDKQVSAVFRLAANDTVEVVLVMNTTAVVEYTAPDGRFHFSGSLIG